MLDLFRPSRSRLPSRRRAEVQPQAEAVLPSHQSEAIRPSPSCPTKAWSCPWNPPAWKSTRPSRPTTSLTSRRISAGIWGWWIRCNFWRFKIWLREKLSIPEWVYAWAPKKSFIRKVLRYLSQKSSRYFRPNYNHFVQSYVYPCPTPAASCQVHLALLGLFWVLSYLTADDIL